MPSDKEIEIRIERLEDERERLRLDESESAESAPGDAARLEQIRVELDRLWDLLRQRRALRDAGRNPDDASERPGGAVEGYLQ